MAAIDTQTIDQFIAARRKEPGLKAGSNLSPASINHDLRHLKAALRVAAEWGYLAKVPKFRMEKEPKKLPTYVNGDDFATIYRSCDQARYPDEQSYQPGDWWRALLVMGYMTGWRISDLLGLPRDDLDLDAGTAVTRARDNKGKRDEEIKLHPVVLEHLRKLASFDTSFCGITTGEPCTPNSPDCKRRRVSTCTAPTIMSTRATAMCTGSTTYGGLLPP